MPDSILAIDVGSTACKGLQITTDGECQASASLLYADTNAPHDPHGWWRALCQVLARLHAEQAVAPAGVCLCGRGNDVAFLDADGEPVEVPWPELVARAWTRRAVSTSLGRATGWGAMYQAIRSVAPRTADRIVRVCGVKDYLNFKLTGAWATDASSAGCRAWSEDATAQGLRREMLPPIRPAHEVLGGVSASVDGALRPGLPVLVGSHDGVCANIGAGMLAVGDGCVTLGTHAVLRVNTAQPLIPTPEFATFTYPYLGDTWTSGGDVVAGGAAAVWMARVLGAFAARRGALHGDLTRLDALAATAPPGASGLIFVPYLRGTVSPRRALDRRGIFLGVAAAHGAGEFARATLEGVAFAIRHVRDAFVGRGGIIHRLSLTGGGARSRVWPGIIASVLDTPFGLVDPDASARGAAVLAAAGLGLHPSVEAASAAMTHPNGCVAPDPRWVHVYEESYRRYLATVEA
jgi:sugar (pentulose or hexulose) kinase